LTGSVAQDINVRKLFCLKRLFNLRIPEALVLIVNKSLEKDVEKRYQRAGQVSDHLRKLNEMINRPLSGKRFLIPQNMTELHED